MARPKEFTEDKALDGAIDIFWKRGYARTTLPDLLTAMGISRGSFYAAFTDKYTTYCLALAQYHTVNLANMLAKMRTQTSLPLVDRLLFLFEDMNPSSPFDSRLGCFICNTMVEFGTTDPIIAQKVNQMANDIEACLYDIVRESGKDTATAKYQSKAILQLYLGAQAVHKSGGNVIDFRTYLQAIVA